MKAQNQKLQRMFDSDSTIMMEALSRMLGAIEPGELHGPDVDRAFRAAHSVKSEAGFLNIDEVAIAAHRLEDVLSGVRNQGGAVDQDVARDLRRGVRSLSQALAEYRESRAPGEVPRPDVDDDRSGADEAAEEPRPSADVGRAERGMLREAKKRGEHIYRVLVRVTCDPELRYARGFLVVNNVELSCAVVRTEPPLEELTSSGSNRLALVVTSGAAEEVFSDAVHRAVHVDEVELVELSELSFDEFLEEDVDAPETQNRPDGVGVERVTVPVESQEEVALYADEICAAAEDAIGAAGADEDVASRLKTIAGYARALRDRTGSSARVQLLDLFRELRTSSVRYSAGQGKRVRIIVGGGGAVVPPAVGDTLLEAVMHLIRNSIDHGIESIEQRASSGRHPAATIKVRVDRVGGRVRIVVQDDGTGIDEAAVRARAGDAKSPLLAILAAPGFSMRDVPDANSGRGVGLDNVVHSVRALLGGKIELVNRAGAGMTFVITVSGSTRLLHVLLAESGGTAFAVPSASVVTHERIERRRVKRDSFGSLYYDYDGRILALATLGGRSASLKGLGDEALVVIVRAGVELRAILIDALLGEETVVREQGRMRRVYARSLGHDVDFIFPPALESGTETATVRA